MNKVSHVFLMIYTPADVPNPNVIIVGLQLRSRLSNNTLDAHCDACKINGGDVDGEKTRSCTVEIRVVDFDKGN
jgi:hypothetical protein